MPLTPPPKSIWERPPLALPLSQAALALLFAAIFIYAAVRLPHDHKLLELSGGGTLMFTAMALGSWGLRRIADRPGGKA